MQNSAKASHKFSRLETAANLCIIVILALQLLLAIVASLISANISVNDLTSVDWIEQTKDGSSTAIAWLIIQLIGTWILILNNFVPISLVVQIELLKFWQAGFMTREVDMYDVREGLIQAAKNCLNPDEEKDMPMQANASNLVEELGMVQSVFSDKTGTLTCNIMEFRKFTAGEKAYGLSQLPTTE